MHNCELTAIGWRPIPILSSLISVSWAFANILIFTDPLLKIIGLELSWFSFVYFVWTAILGHPLGHQGCWGQKREVE